MTSHINYRCRLTDNNIKNGLIPRIMSLNDSLKKDTVTLANDASPEPFFG